jgi:fructose-bisphosphate aldolase class I
VLERPDREREVDAVTSSELERTAAALVSRGKGILAADETVPTLTKRFDALKIESTPSSRRDYRQMMLTTPGVAEFISGVILYEETLRQQSSDGSPLVSVCSKLGIVAGIKVDKGAKPLAGSRGERVTEGLDGLRERLAEYRDLGARFAKWRAVFDVSDTHPSSACVAANAQALARYAALCQEEGLVPIVEPEALMDGLHTIERCEEVTSGVLHAVFDALFDQGVELEGMLLKPNMAISGIGCPRQASVAEVAAATLRCLRRNVPPAVPGVVFLSGGQNDVVATRHLNAINQAEGPKPWTLSFSYGRALQDAALATWRGKPERLAAAQRSFYHRARCNGLAALGAYTEAEEDRGRDARAPSVAAEWHDD